MPAGLDVSATFEVVLPWDRSKPAAERPTFVCRYMTGRQWREIADTEARTEHMSGNETIDELFRSAGQYLVGWRHMIDPQTGGEIAFDKDRLVDVLAPHEVQELIEEQIKGGVPSLGEGDGSGSAASSKQENYAGSASPVSA